ncbi:hypothetical protein LXL04_004239 [Taraxacum kok-saghyz]
MENRWSSFMESMKMMNLFAIMMVMAMAVSAVSVSAQAPAPAPTSDATTVFIPTAIASLSALKIQTIRQVTLSIVDSGSPPCKLVFVMASSNDVYKDNFVGI